MTECCDTAPYAENRRSVFFKTEIDVDLQSQARLPPADKLRCAHEQGSYAFRSFLAGTMTGSNCGSALSC